MRFSVAASGDIDQHLIVWVQLSCRFGKQSLL